MKRFAWLVFTICLVSCAEGTNTGNPGMNPVGSQSTVALNLVVQICAKVASCHAGADEKACFDEVSELPGYPLKLGAVAQDFLTMSELSTAESEQVVSVNRSESRFCVEAIANLSCDDPRVQRSYSSGSYANSNRLFEASAACMRIY